MNDIDYIQSLVANGGPERTQWMQLTIWTHNLLARHQRGEITIEQMQAIRDAFGDAFSNDTMQGFAYHKPHGYAGDYEIIDRIYQYYLAPSPHTKWDEYWQAHPAANAVRNRKSYFHDILKRTAGRKPAAEVLKIASGPGRSMYEWLCAHDYEIKFDCIELDKNAIEFASNLNRPFLHRISFINMNALRFKPEKKYDLIWAAGIFDYFDDAKFVSLLSRLRMARSADGEVVIGNFSTRNPSESYMRIFDWNLFHRDVDQLRALALAAGAPPDAIHIGQEPEGVNLFLHILG